jgi:hypothetical protein
MKTLARIYLARLIKPAGAGGRSFGRNDKIRPNPRIYQAEAERMPRLQRPVGKVTNEKTAPLVGAEVIGGKIQSA